MRPSKTAAKFVENHSELPTPPPCFMDFEVSPLPPLHLSTSKDLNLMNLNCHRPPFYSSLTRDQIKMVPYPRTIAPTSLKTSLAMPPIESWLHSLTTNDLSSTIQHILWVLGKLGVMSFGPNFYAVSAINIHPSRPDCGARFQSL